MQLASRTTEVVGVFGEELYGNYDFALSSNPNLKGLYVDAISFEDCRNSVMEHHLDDIGNRCGFVLC